MKEMICNILNLNEGTPLIRYLGIPLSNISLRHTDFIALTKKIKNKMDGWQTKILRLVGKTELIRFTVYPILQYRMQ